MAPSFGRHHLVDISYIEWDGPTIIVSWALNACRFFQPIIYKNFLSCCYLPPLSAGRKFSIAQISFNVLPEVNTIRLPSG